jgi:hypothetical protein
VSILAVDTYPIILSANMILGMAELRRMVVIFTDNYCLLLTGNFIDVNISSGRTCECVSDVNGLVAGYGIHVIVIYRALVACQGFIWLHIRDGDIVDTVG